MSNDLVQVWRKSDGAPQMVPRHWLDHPTLGQPFTTVRPAVVPECCGGSAVEEDEDTQTADAPAPEETTTDRAARPRKKATNA